MLNNSSENEKTKPEFWNNRVLEAKGDPQALVYASAGKLQRSQIIGEELIKMIVRPGMTFLDVGCGYGRYYPAVIAAGGIYSGIDFSEEMIKEAKKRHPDGNFSVNTWHKYTNQVFGVVFESICHSSTDMLLEDFVELLQKFCNENGKVIIIEPNICGIFTKGNIFDE